MNGMELSRQYFSNIAEPRLKADFPEYYSVIAAGLVGNGSECFGYDDTLSRDHDWGVDFFLWLPEAARHAIPLLQQWKNDLFENAPPEHARTRSEYGARIGVMTVGDFYASLIGYPEGPASLGEWRRVPEENLAMAVNGSVFIDHHGAFTATREKLLLFYPEDLRRKRLAAKCMAMAQTGQYNFGRCYIRKDWVTLKTVLSRFTDNAISAVFLLNKVYRPYYKWCYRKMTELPILGKKIGDGLNDIAILCDLDDTTFQRIEKTIGTICQQLIDELHHQHLTTSDDWFLTTQGEEIQQSITDGFLRGLPAQYE